jgi:cold-inducible RNA-binding protein
MPRTPSSLRIRVLVRRRKRGEPANDHARSRLFQDDLNLHSIHMRSVMAHKLFIGGLSFSTTDERLRELFATAGGVESAVVVTDRDTGRSRGFGFVEMTTAEDADAAAKKFDGQMVDGRTLKVEVANSAGSGGAGRGGGSGSRGATRW